MPRERSRTQSRARSWLLSGGRGALVLLAAVLGPATSSPAQTPQVPSGELTVESLVPPVIPGGLPASSEQPAEGKERSRFHLEASWDNGLRFASADDQFHVHVGGNAQVDSAWLIGPKGVFAVPGGGMNGV